MQVENKIISKVFTIEKIEDQFDTTDLQLTRAQIQEFGESFNSLILQSKEATLEVHVEINEHTHPSQKNIVITRLAADILGLSVGSKVTLTDEINYFEVIERDIKPLKFESSSLIHHPRWTISTRPLNFLIKHWDQIEAHEDALYSAITQFNSTINETSQYKMFLTLVRNFFKSNPNVLLKMLNQALNTSSANDDDSLFALFIRNIVLQNNLINIQNSAGETPLHFACRHGNPNLIGLLCEKDANYNAKTNNGETPLHELMTLGPNFIKAIKTFFDSIDPSKLIENAQDSLGLTPLHLALTRGDIFVMRYFKQEKLLSYLKIKNHAGKTPIELAINNGHKELLNHFFMLLLPHPDSI